MLGVNFSKATCHIDHKEPKTFGQILEDFLSKYKLNFNSIEILNVDDIYDTIKCEKIRENWFNFHKETAVLRAIHKTANLSSSKRKYNF